VKQYEGGSGNLVDSVEGGVARVELDGGQDGLTVRSSGVGYGGSNSRGSSKGCRGSSDSSDRSSHSRSSSSISQSWDSGIVESWDSSESGIVERKSSSWESGEVESSSWESGEVESSSVRVRQSSDGGSSNNSLLISITSLPVSISSLEKSEVGSLGLGNLGSVLDGLRGNSGEDRGDKGLGVEGWGHQRLDISGDWDGGSDWEVGASNSESVNRVSHIVDGLEKTVSINVLVGPSGHTEGIAGLSTGQWTASMSERELSKLILSMELG